MLTTLPQADIPGNAASRSPLFSAYQFSGRRGLLCLRSALPLISDDAPTKWCHLAYEGEWHGHQEGRFELTRALFKQAIANLESQVNPVPLDFDHEREFMAPPWPARGWVHELKVVDGDDGKAHLWGLVEFGPDATEFNRKGGYRYCSVVLDFEARDRVTGDPIGLRLKSLALTDEPFIDGQTPIVLSMRAARRALSTGDRMQKLTKEALLAALDQFEGDEIDMEQLQAAAHLAAVKDGGAEEEAPEAPMADKPEDEDKPKGPPMEEDEDKDAKLSDEPEAPVAAGEEPGEDEVAASEDTPPVAAADEVPDDSASAALAPLMEATGMDAVALAAAIQENMDAVVSALSGALQEPAAEAPLSAEVKSLSLRVKAGDETIKALSQRAEKAEQELATRRQADAEAEVETLISEGRLMDSVRDDFVQLALSDRPRFDRIAASLPSTVPVGGHASGIKPAKGNDAAPIDESDPTVKSYRRTLSAAGIPKDVQDTKIRARLAARN